MVQKEFLVKKEKKVYMKAEIKNLGRMIKITQGNGGSCVDGGQTPVTNDQNCSGQPG